MSVFSFDVEVSSHEALRAGICALPIRGSQHAHHRVVIEAPSHAEAALLACQMAARHGMVTRLFDRV